LGKKAENKLQVSSSAAEREREEKERRKRIQGKFKENDQRCGGAD